MVDGLCPFCHNNEHQVVRWVERRADNRLILVTLKFCTHCGNEYGEEREEVRRHEVFGHH